MTPTDKGGNKFKRVASPGSLPIHLKVYGYIPMFCGEQHDFLLTSPDGETHLRGGLLLGAANSFFFAEVDFTNKGGKNENGRVASPESLPIHLNNSKPCSVVGVSTPRGS